MREIAGSMSKSSTADQPATSGTVGAAGARLGVSAAAVVVLARPVPPADELAAAWLVPVVAGVRAVAVCAEVEAPRCWLPVPVAEGVAAAVVLSVLFVLRTEVFAPPKLA